MGRLGRRYRIPIMAMLATAMLMAATSGVAQAFWAWCDDPVMSVGNSSLGYTTVYVSYAVDTKGPAEGLSSRFSASLHVNVPQGVDFNLVDSQGWSVTNGTDPSLRVKAKAIQSQMTVNIVPVNEADAGTKVKVTVALDPNGKRVIGRAVAVAGNTIQLRVNIPAGYSQ